MEQCIYTTVSLCSTQVSMKICIWGVQGGSLSPFLLGMYKEVFMSTESSGARALAGLQQYRQHHVKPRSICI